MRLGLLPLCSGPEVLKMSDSFVLGLHNCHQLSNIQPPWLTLFLGRQLHSYSFIYLSIINSTFNGWWGAREDLNKSKKYAGKMFKNNYFKFLKILICDTFCHIFSRAFQKYKFFPWNLLKKRYLAFLIFWKHRPPV